MKRAMWLLVLVLAFAGRALAAESGGEEAAVLEVVDRFMVGISTADFEELRALHLPDAVTHRVKVVSGGGAEVAARPASYWYDPANRGPEALNERYWAPTVQVRKAIAVVWAPYEFKRDGKTSHCGIDVFNLVKSDGAWRIASAMWTVEPEACAELRPADREAVRPRE